MARVLLFIPALFALVELAVLIEVGERIGTGPTLALVLAGVVVGVVLVKRGGLGALMRARASLAAGEAPTGALFDLACIVAGGVLFLFPGFVSDVLALPLVFPPSRAALLRWLARRFGVGGGASRTTVIEGEWREVHDKGPRLPR